MVVVTWSRKANEPVRRQPNDSATSVPANRLIRETSPYLLQHAHNPVDWFPWGGEALERAKRQDKPIFLSVGYSTCYWCHVMEQQSFQNAEVARVLNENFVAIKVDREERPDIDEHYMLATQLLTGRGGWPNSVWLTPDGSPWMAGTYFPLQQFIQILKRLSEMWKTRRPDVERQADQVSQAMRRAASAPAAQAGPVDESLVDGAISQLRHSYDPTNGGFGGAPKFPPHGSLALLIHEYRRSGDSELLEMITGTLDAMARGGIRDHLGGGFHRYSVDDHWLIPHFEKMLCDDAQLMRAYADGFALTGNRQYRQVVEDIFRWLQAEMTDANGAFLSAIDAGAVGEEGEFYLWRRAEVLDILGRQDGELFCEVYGLTEGGNYHKERAGERPGTNIIHLAKTGEQSGQDNEPDSAQLAARRRAMREKLLSARNRRPRPHKDDKVLAAWNGLMIAGLAHAGRVLEEPRYVQAAEKAADFVTTAMTTDDGRLLRTYRAGRARLPGYLDDYASLAAGLLELYRADRDTRWLEHARRLADVMLEDFRDKTDGGFFFSTAEHDEVLPRSKNLLGGGNMPSPNGAAVGVLLRLGRLTGEARYTQAGLSTLDSLSSLMWQYPLAAETLILAAAVSLESPVPAETATAPSAARDRPAPPDAHKPDARAVQHPVTAELYASRLTAKPEQTFHLAVALDIAEGWHLYAPSSAASYVVPTTISVKAADWLKPGAVTLPKSRRAEDPVLHARLDVYEGRVWLVVPLTVSKDSPDGQADLEVEVNFQACNDNQCLAPQTVTLQVQVAVTRGESTGDLRHSSIFRQLSVAQ